MKNCKRTRRSFNTETKKTIAGNHNSAELTNLTPWNYSVIENKTFNHLNKLS